MHLIKKVSHRSLYRLGPAHICSLIKRSADADPVGGVALDGGLYFGVGRNLESGSLFSGLIDDIRVYPLALNAEQIAALGR